MEIDIAEIQRLPPEAVSLWIPYPPEGSNCDSIINSRDVDTGFNIFGAYQGDINKDGYIAQDMFNSRTPITGVSFVVGKWSDITDPIIVGFARASDISGDINDVRNFLHDPGRWLIAGALYPDQLPEKETFYWVSWEFNLDYSPDVIWFLAVTNQNYSVPGWTLGAHLNHPFAMSNRWWWDINGQTGWYATDAALGITNYSQGGAPHMPGMAKIENPNFPGTAQEGTPYNYSFELYNLHDLSCGCPQTMCLVIINRDTEEPISPVWSQELPCGNYFTFSDQITFSGSGIFHGQLQAGHVEGENCVIDETYDFDIEVSGTAPPPPPPSCEEITDGTECINAGCYWWRDNTCHSTAEPIYVIGEIDFSQSMFYGGPFNPGQAAQTIAMVRANNIGTTQGNIHIKAYEYPGTINERQIFYNGAFLQSGGGTNFQVWLDIPNRPGEIWPVGVKVWGESEPEPSWASAGTHIFEVQTGENLK